MLVLVGDQDDDYLQLRPQIRQLHYVVPSINNVMNKIYSFNYLGFCLGMPNYGQDTTKPIVNRGKGGLVVLDIKKLKGQWRTERNC